MRVLAVNAGSSSLKLSVVSQDQRLAETTVESWDGEDLSGLRDFVAEVGDVDAVAHRVVHGGPRLTSPVQVDDAVLAELDAVSALAPLHNPPAVQAMRATMHELDVPAVACFDTAFHADLPDAAATYALPAEWNSRWQLRRYGAHGLSHAHVVRRTGELLGRDVSDLHIVSCHLGSGASLAAVKAGRSVDTTMGFTPLEGLVMSTRSGSVDPGLLLWLQQHGHVGVDELADTLEHRSGLAGLSGTSGDLRDVLEGRSKGDAACALALEVYLHRLRAMAAAMVAAAGGIDVLAFTGGIGERSSLVRAGLAAGLSHLDVALDETLDERVHEGLLSAPGASVASVVVKAGEDLQMANEATVLLHN